MSVARKILWVLTIAYWAGIFYMTHQPPSRAPYTGRNDKVLHFGGYLGLGFLVGSTLLLAVPRARRLLPLWVILVAAGYGAFDEITQAFVRRTPDVHDWLADCAGAAVGAGIIWVVQLLSPRPAGIMNDDTPLTSP
jgi:VanZ family protein